MKHLLRRCAASLALGFAALSSLPALALPYTSLTVFGDSLSDTGNVFLFTSGQGSPFPTAPYYNGRFSDGPVWIDVLAAGLGLPAGAVASNSGQGTNYAWGGARTGTGTNPTPGLLVQVGSFWNQPAADPNGLYVVVGGGNDLRDARGAAGTPESRQAAAEAAAGNLFSVVGLLASRGAKHVLISNVPDLGVTPEAVGLGLVANSSDVTQRFNMLIGGAENVLEATYSGLNVSFLNMAALASAVYADALGNGGAVYGITNVTTPCGTFTGSVGIACNVSLFSDALHPTAAAHALIGQAALIAVVPEPGTWLLMAVGVVAVVFRRRSTPAL